MASVFDVLSDSSRAKLRRRRPSNSTAPMLATLVHEPFSDDEWLYERKLDGVRIVAFRFGQRVRLVSRNRQERRSAYPEIADALSAQDADGFIVDGEIVALEGGVTSFARLQRRMQLSTESAARATGIAVYYYAFDVLYCSGHDVTALPLRDRKRVLRQLLSFSDPLRFTQHRNAEGVAFFEEACSRGWEGVIAKKADSAYVHRRSADWLKFKCENRQEFVVGGYTEPRGARQGFGALLLGYYENGALRYAGRVGTGWDDATLRELGGRLASLERDTSPFHGQDQIRTHGVHWVKPKLVGDVAFTEWTSAGRLRHPRWIGLRRDKPAKHVVRERARSGGSP